MSAHAMSAGAPPSLASAYRRLWWRRWWLAGALLALALVGFLLDVATGPAFLPVLDVARTVFGGSGDPTVSAIVWSIRLPVACSALVVGAALGLSGAVMQTILHNPLASSYTLGVSAGAGFGAALVIVLGSGLAVPETVSIPVMAMLFAALACTGVYLIGGARAASAEALVLAGIALLFLFQALTSLLQLIASPEALQQVVFWLFGSLQKATWTKLAIMAAVLVAGLAVLLPLAWQLTALKLGDARAQGLGVSVRGLRLLCFAVISALTGVSVAFVGTIGFVGLVAPHMARMLVGEDQRVFLPASALAGAALLSVSSVASKTLHPGAVFPIGIITSLIGVPFFVALVLRSRRSHW